MWKLWILTKPGEPYPSWGFVGEKVEDGEQDISVERMRRALQIPAAVQLEEVAIEPPGTRPRPLETVFCVQTFRRGMVLTVSPEKKLCRVEWCPGLSGERQTTIEVTPNVYVLRRNEPAKEEPRHRDVEIEAAMSKAIRKINQVPDFPERARVLQVLSALRGFLTEEGTTTEQDHLLREIGVKKPTSSLTNPIMGG